jgi:hypothetical protein
MKLRLPVWILLVVLGLSLFSVAATNAQGGQATLVVVNYVGAEMVFTLDGTVYQVPGVDTAPGGGQLKLPLAAGRHTYSGLIPGRAGSNGEVDLGAGQTVVLGARLDKSAPVISSAGVVLQKPHDVLVFFEASLAPAAPTPTPQPPSLQPLPAGQGALVLVNYIGEALTVNIGGTLYTVPANGYLQVNLAPGEVTYSASAGPSGMNGSAQVQAGVYTGLGFIRETPAPVNYDIGEPAPTAVVLKMSVIPVPLRGEPVAETPSEPAPTAGGSTQLTVVNYVGETVTFTIDNKAYGVAGSGGSLTIPLVPGEYTFTASTPKAAANGMVRIAAGASVRLSVTTNVRGDRVDTYIE